MARRTNAKSIRQRVLELVLTNGKCSIGQVLAAVGRYIGTPTAVSRGRSIFLFHREYDRKRRGYQTVKAKEMPDLGRMADRGRRTCICGTLNLLAREGKIRRLSRGVYGPPLPRIHDATKEAV